MTPSPYWTSPDGEVTLYHGDCREILPQLGLQADLVCTDPPYSETSLAWDRWPDGWPALAASVASSMWCFGSMRMFLDRAGEFADWKLSQDVIWEKHNGSSRAADRFRRVHEIATHWYRGKWSDIHHEAQRTTTGIDPRSRAGSSPDVRSPHLGVYKSHTSWTDNGTRLLKSVLQVRSTHHAAIHPTEKPIDLVAPLIRYACPPGGLVVDPFAGSGSTLDAARQSGRRAIGIEANEAYCEAAARRLDQLALFGDTA